MKNRIGVKEVIVGNSVILEFTSSEKVGRIVFNDNGFTIDGPANSRKEVAVACVDAVKIDCSLSNSFNLLLTENVSSIELTNLLVGSYLLMIRQDTTGGRTLAFGTKNNYKFTDGTEPTITADANAIDIITLYYDGTNVYVFPSQNFLTKV